MKSKILLFVIFVLALFENLAAQALIDAVKSGDIEKVRELLPYEEMEEIDSEYYTAYHWTAILGRTDMAELLLENGAEPNMFATDKAQYRKMKNTGQLIWAGDLTGARDAAVLAEENGNDELIDFYLSKGDIDRHLISAVMCENKKVAKKALDFGADANTYVNRAGGRIIEAAVKLSLQSGTDELIDVLLENGADISLAFAASFVYGNEINDAEIWEKMLDKGAKIDQEYEDSNYDDSLLGFAFKDYREAKFNFLLSHGADVRKKYKHGRTVLHTAVIAHKSVARLIPSEDKCDKDCMMEYLSIRDDSGDTACDIAQRIYDNSEENSYDKKYAQRTMKLVCDKTIHKTITNALNEILR